MPDTFMGESELDRSRNKLIWISETRMEGKGLVRVLYIDFKYLSGEITKEGTSRRQLFVNVLCKECKEYNRYKM